MSDKQRGGVMDGFVMEVAGPQVSRTGADSMELYEPFLGLSPEEYKTLAASVLIVIPHRPTDGINKALFRNAGMWALMGTNVATVSDQFTGFIELTRAGIVRTFLSFCRDHPEVEYCCMVDDDEGIPWDAPYRLAQWGKDVVSGIVCSFSEKKGGVFACVTIKDRNGIARFPTVKRTQYLPAKGLREIESAGTGLLCVHKRVFEKMLEADESPFAIPEDIRKHCALTGTLKLGEDMAFSERCKRFGFRMFVDFSVRAKHYKVLEVAWPEGNVKANVDAATWEVATDDYIHV